jgi:hypothetical protein
VTVPRPKTYLPFLWFVTLFILGRARLLDIGAYSWVVLQLLAANGIKWLAMNVTFNTKIAI